MDKVEEKTNIKNNETNENISTFKKVKKVLNYIGKVLSYASIVLLVIIGAFLLYYLFTMQKYKNDPEFKPEVSLYTIISGSMEPILKVGGILYYEKINLDDFKKDDILVYQLNEHIVSHRIVNINEYGFETKGDNNNSNDSYIVDKNNVIGRGNNWSIPYIGYYADFIYNHKYLLIVMIILSYFNIWFNSRKDKKGYEEIS